jgi:peptide/nickel transport system substrate-binding protein
MITLELLTSDGDLEKKTGEFLKGQLEKNLEGLTVNIKPQPRKQQVSLLLKGDYEIGIDGWSPDFADPITFLELFTTNNPYNLDHYSNKEFDEAIEKVKTTLAGDEKARFDALLASEKILFKDSIGTLCSILLNILLGECPTILVGESVLLYCGYFVSNSTNWR